MPTLRDPQISDFSEQELAVLAKLAQRQGRTLEELLQPTIGGVQAHWPDWLQENVLE